MQFDASCQVAAGGIINNICSLILNIEMQASNPFYGICFKTGLIFGSHFNACEFWRKEYYEGWNFNSGNYLFTADTK